MGEQRALAKAYIAQQWEMGMPDFILSPRFDAALCLKTITAPAPSATAQPFSPGPQPVKPDTKPRPIPVSHLMVKKTAAHTPAVADSNDPVRSALAALFHSTKNCADCGLSKSRIKFVFGSGNPHAKLMVIGEAPGHDEDVQGLPFVGAAGELLTKMLAAIKLDRKKQVFIANALKCRPPDNRTPESSELLACSRILSSQIDIIKPKVILLLGKTAAHALLDTTESIAALRVRSHSVHGIPAYVTYHPAALLRNQSYKRPTWEDMQKLETVLVELDVYADTNQ
jgi:uracil-DNA glycosylase family 4